MKRKDVIILKYKMIELIPKDGGKQTEEPDWESMKINPNQITKKYDSRVAWVKKTFNKKGILSLEDHEEGCIVNHEEGVFVVSKSFKKVFKLIYK